VAVASWGVGHARVNIGLSVSQLGHGLLRKSTGNDSSANGRRAQQAKRTEDKEEGESDSGKGVLCACQARDGDGALEGRTNASVLWAGVESGVIMSSGFAAIVKRDGREQASSRPGSRTDARSGSCWKASAA